MKTWTIQTQADTRSKSRQAMSHRIVDADTEADAIWTARMAHLARLGQMNWDVSVWVVSVRMEGAN